MTIKMPSIVLVALLALSCVHTCGVSARRAQQIAEEYVRRIPEQNPEMIKGQCYTAVPTTNGWGVVVARPGDVSILKLDSFGRIRSGAISAVGFPQTNTVPITKKEARQIADNLQRRNSDQSGNTGVLPFQTTDGWAVVTGHHGDFVVIFINKSGAVTDVDLTE